MVVGRLQIDDDDEADRAYIQSDHDDVHALAIARTYELVLGRRRYDYAGDCVFGIYSFQLYKTMRYMMFMFADLTSQNAISDESRGGIQFQSV